jgi:arginine decarboxylase
LIYNFRNIAEQAVKLDKITPRERKEIMTAYEEGLRGYTYFEK